MSPGKQSPRPWQVIAEEASHETNRERVIELAEELDRALEERDKELSSSAAKKKSVESTV